MPPAEPDATIKNAWHVCGTSADIQSGNPSYTQLLDRRLQLSRNEAGRVRVALDDGTERPSIERYGFVWTSIGDPKSDLFGIKGYDEDDRQNVVTGAVGVRVSVPRAVENFLDMGHFPFVHTGVLGDEPHTEVNDYTVEIDEIADEVVATECEFYQPKAAATAEGGIKVEYIYRVHHPYCAILYRTCPLDPNRFDTVALFVQPVSEEQVIGHTMMSVVDDRSSVADIRHFQLLIFGQDKPILENQKPRKLPLDPRAETPIRADKSSIAYRRWLTSKDIRYGVIAAA